MLAARPSVRLRSVLRSLLAALRPGLLLGLACVLAAGSVGVPAALADSPAGGPSSEISSTAEPDSPSETGADSEAGAESRASDRARATFAFSRAKLLADAGRLVEASQSFDEALRLDPTDAYAFTEAAKFHLYLAQISRQAARRSTHLERASELAEKARELAPRNPDALRVYGDIYMRMAEMDPQALAQAQEAFRVLAEDDDLQALTSLAQIELWQRDAEEAVEILRRAANLAPNHRMIQSMLVEALLGTGNTEEAAPALEKLLEIDPEHFEGRIRLAEILSDRGEHRRAVEVLRAAPDDFSQRFRLRQVLSRELHLAGEHREALALSDELLEDAPRSPGFYRLRMSILASLARYEKAVELLDPERAEVPVLTPADEDMDRHLQDLLLLARLEERAGRAESAAERVRSALETVESAAEGPAGEQAADARARRVAKLRLSLAGILQRMGRAEEAAGWIEPLLDRSKAQAPEGQDLALYAQSLAEVWIAAGEVERAVDLLDGVAERLDDPAMADALRLRQALDLSEIERWDAVLARVDRLAEAGAPEIRQAARQLRAEALAATGRVGEALEKLGAGDEPPQLRAKRLQLLMQHGREGEAFDELDTLAASGEADDLLFVARVLQSEDRHERAVPLLRELAAERPDSVQILFMLGAALERSGDHAAAVEVFERLLEVDPDHAPAQNYLGYMWAEQAENLDRALDLILRAVAQEPDNGAYVDSLGWAYFQLGRYEQARQHLEWAARLVDDDPTIHHHLGDVYRALERPEEARAAYRRALELSGPDRDGQLDAVDRADVERKLEELSRSGP